MKCSIGGELEAEVGDDFRAARRAVQNAVNAAMEARVYDVPFTSWGCVVVVRNDAVFGEVMRYSHKKNEMDIHLNVGDYGSFKNSDGKTRERMIFATLVRTLEILRSKGLPAEGIASMEADLRMVGKAHGYVDE